MEFRRATRDDAPSILRFWQESGATTSTTDRIPDIRRACEHPTAIVLLAVNGPEILGSVIGTFDGWRGHLYRLVVRPDHRRRGLGRDLVRQVEAVFGEWGVKRVNALVETDHPIAGAFWSAVGYPADEHIRRHVRTA